MYMQLHKIRTGVKLILSLSDFTDSTGCSSGTWLPTSGRFSLPWMSTTRSTVEDGVSPALTTSPGSSPSCLSLAVQLLCGRVHHFSGYINCMFQVTVYC